MTNTHDSIDTQARKVNELNREAWRLDTAGDPRAVLVFEELDQASGVLTDRIEKASGR